MNILFSKFIFKKLTQNWNKNIQLILCCLIHSFRLCHTFVSLGHNFRLPIHHCNHIGMFLRVTNSFHTCTGCFDSGWQILGNDRLKILLCIHISFSLFWSRKSMCLHCDIVCRNSIRLFRSIFHRQFL